MFKFAQILIGKKLKYGCSLLSLTIIRGGICRYDLILFVLEGLDCSFPEHQDKDNAT